FIFSDIRRDWLKEKWLKGAVKPCGTAPELTEERIDQTTALVAQMGIDPIINALHEKPDVIIAGRAYDPVIFAALPI
ncbi:acyclic terpene utilization AtuA family protein, partial [Bacillus thuringiensis]